MKTEANLLALARQFDQKALASIYDLYSDAIYKYAFRRLGDAQSAEDCVSETFHRFLRALQQGRGPQDHLRAYLYRIAHNWISDQYRRQPPPAEDLEDFDPADPKKTPEQVTVERVEHGQIQAALHRLTDEQQQAIVLKFLEGWSNEEIAHTMQKSVGSVKALQQRGLAALRRLMLEESSNE